MAAVEGVVLGGADGVKGSEKGVAAWETSVSSGVSAK
jgi:hypothetical protein